jgi:hypothetical protein
VKLLLLMKRTEWRERLMWAIAARVPSWLTYLCAVRVGANATTGEWSGQVVPDLKFMDALHRWPGRF